jgi:hypothetical protein
MSHRFLFSMSSAWQIRSSSGRCRAPSRSDASCSHSPVGGSYCRARSLQGLQACRASSASRNSRPMPWPPRPGSVKEVCSGLRKDMLTDSPSRDRSGNASQQTIPHLNNAGNVLPPCDRPSTQLGVSNKWIFRMVSCDRLLIQLGVSNKWIFRMVSCDRLLIQLGVSNKWIFRMVSCDRLLIQL